MQVNIWKFFLGIQDLWLQAVIAAKLSQPLIIAILQGTAWEAQQFLAHSYRAWNSSSILMQDASLAPKYMYFMDSWKSIVHSCRMFEAFPCRGAAKQLSPSSIKLGSELRDKLSCIFRFDFNGTPPKSPLGCWYRAVWSIGAPAFEHAWQYKTRWRLSKRLWTKRLVS